MNLSDNDSIESDLDARPLSYFQIRIIAVCALVAMIDGFDTQSIAFMAPAIAQAWGVPSAEFGPVFGAGLFGTLIGALAFGVAADRFGRKPCLLISIFLFSVMSCATPLLAHSMRELFVLRVITGIGLGGAIPIIIALTTEYAPRRFRATLITAMFCGFPLGAAIGAVASARLIPVYGWESVLILGGVIPLAILPFVHWLVPESIRFLLVRGRTRQANQILLRLNLAVRSEETKHTSDLAGAARQGNSKPSMLFKEGRATGTILLWLTFFLSLALTYFLINWIPIVARDSGVQLQGAVIGVATLNLGGIIGCVCLGRLIDRFGPFGVISTGYVIGAMAIAAIGFATTSMTLGVVTFVAGFFALGSQMCVMALAAAFYPTYLRGTGVGFSMGIGRTGGIAGPVVGGLLVGMGMSAKGIFLFTAVMALLAAASVLLMGRLTGSSK